MKDKLTEIITACQNKKVIERTGSGPFIDMISFKTLDNSNIQAIRSFQDAVFKKFNVRMEIVGGGYGCSKIFFRIDTNSPDLARLIIEELIESSWFREEALKARFSVAIVGDPYAR